MPAEWEPHARTWMCWPCRAELWGDGMDAAKRAHAAVARAIARFEPVTIAANPADASEASDMTGADIFAVPLDDSWARDIGPTFVKDPAGDRAAIGWRFNAWGGKYAPFDRDAAFAAAAAAQAGVPFHPASIICEGGAIHSDGQGTILTTEQCLLNPNRNPGLTRAVAEQVLHYAIGARRVIWLGDGFSDDETDGHVDNIACFAKPGTVILGVPDSADHPDAAPVRIARARLKAEGFEVIELLQPRNIRRDAQGRLLQTSYVNFYLSKDGLIMPSFDDPHDERARETLALAFPGRDITVVPALDIVAGGGGIHCITQQEPQ
ncbi:MAG: agmatine deiminase family protein [Alphaproteobacteria bacterium]|nr:agmatine deiminase family protein [Alphaproteobacteria bacterium]